MGPMTLGRLIMMMTGACPDAVWKGFRKAAWKGFWKVKMADLRGFGRDGTDLVAPASCAGARARARHNLYSPSISSIPSNAPIQMADFCGSLIGGRIGGGFRAGFLMEGRA